MQRIISPESEHAFRPEDTREVLLLNHIANLSFDMNLRAKTGLLMQDVIDGNTMPEQGLFEGQEAEYLIAGLGGIALYAPPDEYRGDLARQMLAEYIDETIRQAIVPSEHNV